MCRSKDATRKSQRFRPTAENFVKKGKAVSSPFRKLKMQRTPIRLHGRTFGLMLALAAELACLAPRCANAQSPNSFGTPASHQINNPTVSPYLNLAQAGHRSGDRLSNARPAGNSDPRYARQPISGDRQPAVRGRSITAGVETRDASRSADWAPDGVPEHGELFSRDVPRADALSCSTSLPECRWSRTARAVSTRQIVR